MDLVDSALGEKIPHEIRCINCNIEIIEYYSENYKGYRGKCLNCKTDFPLD